jgi:hypothetical protein
MDMNLEQQVRARAYELWILDGMASGRDADHWYAAEYEILALHAETTTKPAVAPKRKAAKRAKTKM